MAGFYLLLILLESFRLPQEIKPQDFEELRSTYLKRINEMFDTLAEKFQQLDQ